MRWHERYTLIALVVALPVAVFGLQRLMTDRSKYEPSNAPLIGSLVRIADSHNVCGKLMGQRHKTFIVKTADEDFYYVYEKSQLVSVDNCR